MTISEAIQEIIKLEGKNIFDDSKRLHAMLGDLASQNKKELNIFRGAVDEKVLKLCIDDNLKDNNKIARIRTLLDDKGLSEQWISFVIESLAVSLGWNYTPIEPEKELSIVHNLESKAKPDDFEKEKNIKFIAGEYSTEIEVIKNKLVSLYKKNGYDEDVQKLQDELLRVSSADKIKIVVTGQYSSGKSSIISALTQNNDIRIDSDITTDKADDYDWNGIILTDTPGLYANNEEHTQKAIDEIRQSDLLIYCITSDLFNQYTLKDFKKWAFEIGYSGKMFLVINKMSKEFGEYEDLVENYKLSLNRSLSPHSLNEFPYCFVDAKDYRDGVKDSDTELIEYSHFEDLIKTLNDFIDKKGELGKLDTPIKILKSSIDGVLQSEVSTDQDRAYYNLLSRIERRVCQSRNNVKTDISFCIISGLNPIVEKGVELSRLIGEQDISFGKWELTNLVESTCEKINSKLQDIIENNYNSLQQDLQEIMESNTANYFFQSVNYAVNKKLNFFESKQSKFSREQFNSISDIVKNISGGIVNIATKSVGSASIVLKNSEVSGSILHNVIKGIGDFLKFKFKPWQAVKITKVIGNIAKWLGPLAVVAGIFFDIKETLDEKQKALELESKRIECRRQFYDIAEDISKEYQNELKGFYDVYNNIIDIINDSRQKSESAEQSHKKLTQSLVKVQSDLTEIQNKIFA